MTPDQKEKIGLLMRQHAPLMIQLAYRRTGDPQLAEELVQETFLTACQRADVVCAHEKPLAWLYQTLHYLTLRELNKAQYRWEDVSENLSDSVGAEDPVSLREVLPRALTTEEQHILLLRFEYRLSHKEIAEELGLTEVGCRKQVSRAIQKCRRYIKRE